MTGKRQTFVAGDFCHCAAWRQVPVEHHQMAVFLDRLRQRANDLLACGIGCYVGKVFSQGPTCDRQTPAVQQARIEQRFHQGLYSADVDQLAHRVLTSRPHVSHHGHALADAGEVVERQRDASLVGDREQMQYRVGGAFEGDHRGDCIFKRLATQDVGWTNAAYEQVVHRCARVVAVPSFLFADRFLCGAVRQRQAQRFDGRRHRIGRVHAATRTGAGDGRRFDLAQLGGRDATRRKSPDSFKDTDDVTAFFAQLDRAAIDEHSWPVQPRDGHRATRHVLIATADRNEAIEPLAGDNSLDGVSDHFA